MNIQGHGECAYQVKAYYPYDVVYELPFGGVTLQSDVRIHSYAYKISVLWHVMQCGHMCGWSENSKLCCTCCSFGVWCKSCAKAAHELASDSQL